MKVKEAIQEIEKAESLYKTLVHWASDEKDEHMSDILVEAAKIMDKYVNLLNAQEIK